MAAVADSRKIREGGNRSWSRGAAAVVWGVMALVVAFPAGFGGLAWAQSAGGDPAPGSGVGIVEGVVDIPKSRSGRRTHARYARKSTGRADAALPRAVMYLTGETVPAGPLPEPVKLTQSNLQFKPDLLPIPVGTTVLFPNDDDEYHNVLSYSLVKEFDLGRYLKSADPPAVLFDEPGVVEVNCEIHEHMRAYILVLETALFGLTDEEGRFRLENVPPGQYQLIAWINERTQLQAEVSLAPGGVVRVEPAAFKPAER